jgi:hypothetical protein
VQGFVGLFWLGLEGWSWFSRLGFCVGTVCGRELPNGVACVVWVMRCVFVGVISFRDRLWYTGPRSSSLALVGVFGLFKLFREFWRVRAR